MDKYKELAIEALACLVGVLGGFTIFTLLIWIIWRI
jgi:hypothetical protein